MEAINSLFGLVSGHELAPEDDGPARRTQLIALGVLASVVFAAIFGLAAGSTDWSLAVANTYKLPMSIVMSAVVAVPAGLLAWRLAGAKGRMTDLLLGVTTANFTATLVLASLAPIVALFYHTSAYLGGVLAMGTATLALAVAVWVVVRRVKRAEKGMRMALLMPLGVMVAVQVMALAQMIFLASGFLPEATVFDGGADMILGR